MFRVLETNYILPYFYDLIPVLLAGYTHPCFIENSPLEHTKKEYLYKSEMY